MQRTIAKITIPFYQLYWRVARPSSIRVRAILLCGKQVLLIKNIGKNKWSLPGGKVEKGESLIVALKRELKEELNINKFEIKYLLGQYRQETKSRRDTIVVFVCEVSNKPLLKKQWEIEDAKWFDISQIPPNTDRNIKLRLVELISGKMNLYSNW